MPDKNSKFAEQAEDKRKQKEKRGGGREVEKRQGEIKNKSNKTRRRKERKQNS